MTVYSKKLGKKDKPNFTFNGALGMCQLCLPLNAALSLVLSGMLLIIVQ